MESLHNRDFRFYKSPILNFLELNQNKLRSAKQNRSDNTANLQLLSHQLADQAISSYKLQFEKEKLLWKAYSAGSKKYLKALILTSKLTTNLSQEQVPLAQDN